MAFLVPSPIALVLALIVAFGGVLFMQPHLLDITLICRQSYPSSQSQCRAHNTTETPYQASWRSWYYPKIKAEVQIAKHGVQPGATNKEWNILYHLGGLGPWIEKTVDIVEDSIALPDGCGVEQVHMMARHAERYPTKKVGKRIKNLVVRMRESGLVFKDELAFFNDWELFWANESQIEQLTSTGPFAGTLSAFTTGVRLRTRYHELMSSAQSQFSTTKFWASDSQRVIDTAQYFAMGFFGHDWQNVADLDIISEASSLGADTLTPGDTCLSYVEDSEEGHDNGYTMLGIFRSTYLDGPMKRILASNPGMDLTHDDVYAMQEMCAFETTVRGNSPWCDVFTQEDFLGFEYARDILHYYRAGPGTKYSAAMGWLWLNATTNLMLQGPEAGPFFFSFVHDGDIAPMLTALDILRDDEHLPITHIKHGRKWRKSQISPMGGRTILEVLSCKANSDGMLSKFVRININDGITAIPGCYNGPGKSCPLEDFAARIMERGKQVGDFREVCGLGQEAAERITFLHQ